MTLLCRRTKRKRNRHLVSKIQINRNRNRFRFRFRFRFQTFNVIIFCCHCRKCTCLTLSVELIEDSDPEGSNSELDEGTSFFQNEILIDHKFPTCFAMQLLGRTLPTPRTIYIWGPHILLCLAAWSMRACGDSQKVNSTWTQWTSGTGIYLHFLLCAKDQVGTLCTCQLSLMTFRFSLPYTDPNSWKWRKNPYFIQICIHLCHYIRNRS